MTYPAIVYRKQRLEHRYADNRKFFKGTQYEIVLISKEPDSKFINMIDELPFCAHNSCYTNDNLYHDTFTIYY